MSWRWLGLILTTSWGCSVAQPTTPGEDCARPLTELYEQVAPAVVSITSIAINPTRSSGRFERGEGTGFVVDFNDRGALLVTNAHVVLNAQSVLVSFRGGEQLPAVLVGMDPIFDVALIKVPAQRGLQFEALEFGDSERVVPGQQVVALGNPFGLFQTLTAGIVSAINRVLPAIPFTLSEPYIQTDTPINPGNSGGPLLDVCGRVIGMNTAVISGANDIGFAIPSNLIDHILPMLIKERRVIRPWIGFHGQFIDQSLVDLVRLPLAPGFLVEMVEPDSPAEAAGLRGGEVELSVNGAEFLLGGDIILAFNGVAMNDVEQALQAVYKIRVGQTVELALLRNGKRTTLSYKASERPVLPTDIFGYRLLDSMLP